MRRLSVLFVSLVLMLATVPAWADPSSSVLQLEGRYPECVGGGCVQTVAQGSAVVIGERDGLPVAVTCWHCVRDCVAARQHGRLTIRIGRAVHPAEVIAKWPDVDLALVSIRSPTTLDAVEIDDAPALTANVEMIGFPAGRFSRFKVKLKAKSRRGELIADRPAGQGQSGGGLFQGDRLAGIVWGTGETDSVATQGATVAQFARLFKVKLKIRGTEAPVFVSPAVLPPAPPPPPAPPVNPWYPDPGLTEQLKAINERLKAIEAKAGTPGPAGPVGPAGPMGLPGKEGTNADPTQLNAFAKRLSVLESRGQTVQLIDETGAVISEQTYAPGAPIRLQFNPVTK